jgi:hypothetical protein
MISKVVAGEVATQVEEPTVESVRVEEVVTMLENPTATIAGAFAALDTTLVLALTSSPHPSLVVQFIGDQHLADVVV